MWKLTVVAEARPVIVWVAESVCLRSKNAVVLAPIATPERSAVPLRLSVNVPAVAAVFVTAMLVTIAVVADGTVYRVVLDVAAAVRASALLVVAINYYSLN
jgi:hypothetical protein